MQIFKRSLFFLIVLIFHCESPAQMRTASKSNTATHDISGEAQFLTHFVERGLSMSDNNPAMNASFLYNLGSQVRMGFWGSNVSNLSASDDNFWFKLLIRFKVEFGANLVTDFYVSDSHFYKSDTRNGQQAGADFKYYTYFWGAEWMSNFEGTETNAEYFHFGKHFYKGNSWRYGGVVGFMNSHNPTAGNYFDLKAMLEYLWNDSTSFELAVTTNLNRPNFGRRGDPFIYAGIKLTY